MNSSLGFFSFKRRIAFSSCRDLKGVLSYGGGTGAASILGATSQIVEMATSRKTSRGLLGAAARAGGNRSPSVDSKLRQRQCLLFNGYCKNEKFRRDPVECRSKSRVKGLL